MPDPRMQELDRQRDRARNLRSRSFAVQRGWPQFYTGLAFFLLGLAITVVTFIWSQPGGVTFVMFGLIVVGLTQMARGLGSLSTMKKLDALQAPLSQRQPWLFAPSAFTADGNTAKPGWLADPLGSGGLRFWDGQNWTADTQTTKAASPAPGPGSPSGTGTSTNLWSRRLTYAGRCTRRKGHSGWADRRW